MIKYKKNDQFFKSHFIYFFFILGQIWVQHEFPVIYHLYADIWLQFFDFTSTYLIALTSCFLLFRLCVCGWIQTIWVLIKNFLIHPSRERRTMFSCIFITQCIVTDWSNHSSILCAPFQNFLIAGESCE